MYPTMISRLHEIECDTDIKKACMHYRPAEVSILQAAEKSPSNNMLSLTKSVDI